MQQLITKTDEKNTLFSPNRKTFQFSEIFINCLENGDFKQSSFKPNLINCRFVQSILTEKIFSQKLTKFISLKITSQDLQLGSCGAKWRQ